MSIEKKDPYNMGDVVLLTTVAGTARGRIQGHNGYSGDGAKYTVNYGRGEPLIKDGVAAASILGLAPDIEPALKLDTLVQARQADGSWKLAKISGVDSASNLFYRYTVANLDGGYDYKVYEEDVAVPSEEELKKYTPSATLAAALPDLIIEEVNKARQNPADYAKRLQGLVKLDGLFTVDPVKRQVAVDFLSKLEKRAPLTMATGLGRAALAFASDAGKIDGPKHQGSDGSTAYERMAKHGTGGKGECLSASNVSAFAFVAGFLMSPGHRDILVDNTATHIGVACHFHRTGMDMYIRCVINTGANWKDA
jgi:hypothetical protein